MKSQIISGEKRDTYMKRRISENFASMDPDLYEDLRFIYSINKEEVQIRNNSVHLLYYCVKNKCDDLFDESTLIFPKLCPDSQFFPVKGNPKKYPKMNAHKKY
jgi:hypothetical protein